MTNPSLYEILEVSPKARAAVIRAAYRCLVRDDHPDRNPGDAAAAARTTQINRAYAVLSDPEQRARYDKAMGFGNIDRRGAAAAEPRKPGSTKDGPKLRPFAFRPLD